MPICSTDGGKTVNLNSKRKSEHLRIAIEEDLEYEGRSIWEDLELIHNPTPELDLEEVDTSTEFLGKTLKFPFVISALTGGCEEGKRINEILAKVASHFSIAMELGSQRVLLESEEYLDSFRIARDKGGEILLFGNIGAPQVVKEYRSKNLEKIQKIVDLVEADALVVHLNFLQEGVMVEGEPVSKGLYEALGELIRQIKVPVIVKETGCGIPGDVAVRLRDLGVYALDTGGKGGTVMAKLEAIRAKRLGNKKLEKAALTFKSWGIPTPVAVMECIKSGLPVIASGGIRSGLDCAKALALGATLVGVARPLLICANKGFEELVQYLEAFFLELRLAMFLTGSRNIADLRKRKVIVKGELREYLSELI